MFAAHNNNQPNVLYFDQKLLHMAQKQEGNEKSKKGKGTANGIQFKVVQFKCQIKVENTSLLNGADGPANIIINTNPNDPLFSPQIEVKLELNDEKPPEPTENDNSVKDYEIDDFEDYKHENVKEIQPNSPNDSEYSLFEAESFELMDNEDSEPLALLKKISESKIRKKEPVELFSLNKCLDTCKVKCKTKFSKFQRYNIFEYYQQLSEEEKLNFLRHHIRKPILTRMCSQRDRRRNCSYFLKPYKTGTTHFVVQPEEENLIDCKSLNLTKVCRKFFQATLGIATQEIKDAIKGYELQLAKIVRARDCTKKDDKCKSPQPAGNLSVKKLKIKTKPRKRGEPPTKRCPLPINCYIRCIFKCHQNFNEHERQQICDKFWSLDFKGRKDFILAHMQAKDVESPTSAEYRKSNRGVRAYQSKFFLSPSLKDEKTRVCKHFLLNTLCINHNSIANAIKYADKITGRYMGVDGRRKRNLKRKRKIASERNKDNVKIEIKQEVIDEINS